MSSIAKIYTKEIKKQFKKLHANWEPGENIELGDFGVMIGGLFNKTIFVKKGNLSKKFKIKFKVTKDPYVDHKYFASQKGVSVKFNAKGSINPSGVINAKANVNVEFSKENSVFFSAAECKTISIEDKLALGEDIFKLHKQGKWKKKYVVVTDLVKSGKTVIAISSSSNSEFSISANSPTLEQINLADASAGLDIVSKKNIGYSVDGAKGLSLLFGLAKLQSKFLGLGVDPKMKVRVLNQAVEHGIKGISDSILDDLYEGHPDFEEDSNNLFFGEYLGDSDLN